jgi:hypothetical protein
MGEDIVFCIHLDQPSKEDIEEVVAHAKRKMKQLLAGIGSRAVSDYVP